MLAFYNAWGKRPTKNHEAAGYDFYIPDIDDNDTDKLENVIIPALSKSYGMTKKQLIDLRDLIQAIVYERYDSDDDDYKFTHDAYKQTASDNKWNCVLLCAARAAKSMEPVVSQSGTLLLYNISKFVYDNLVFDVNKGVVGVVLKQGDSLFINSGVKEKVPHNYAGVFMNKSGRASNGYDVRACVVDEDYTGYVHLNAQFHGQDMFKSEIYAGDKFVQQLVLPLCPETAVEVTHDEYDELTSGSARGDDGFGSSNEKH